MEKPASEQILAKLNLGIWVLMATGIAAGIGIGAVMRPNLPPEVPLFYSRPWGQDQLTTPLMLYLPVGLAIGIGFLAMLLGKILRKDAVLAIILVASGIVVQAILLLGILRILLIIT